MSEFDLEAIKKAQYDRYLESSDYKIQQLETKIEKQEKIIKLLKESNDWYSNCDDVGVFARKTKKKVEEIKNG